MPYKIATDQEAYDIGGGDVTQIVENRCCTKYRAVTYFNCVDNSTTYGRPLSSYADNELVPLCKLKKGNVVNVHWYYVLTTLYYYTANDYVGSLQYEWTDSFVFKFSDNTTIQGRAAQTSATRNGTIAGKSFNWYCSGRTYLFMTPTQSASKPTSPPDIISSKGRPVSLTYTISQNLCRMGAEFKSYSGGLLWEVARPASTYTTVSTTIDITNSYYSWDWRTW